MINVNTNTSLQGIQNWENLAKLLETNSTGNVKNGTIDLDKGQITITINHGTNTQSVNVSVPNLGTVDGAPDTAALKTLADKIIAVATELSASGSIAADGTLSAQLKDAITKLEAALSASGANPTSANTVNTSKALFDLYKLMAIMVEVAQKQRDTSREIRLVENQQVQNSIKQQAADIRSAAIISLGFGIASAVVSGIMSGLAMYKQGKAFDQQTNAAKNLNTPMENLKTAQLASSPAAAEANLQSVTAKTPQNIIDKVNQQFDAAKTDFVRDITAADTRLRTAEQAQDTAGDELNAIRNQQPPASQEAIQAKVDAYDAASNEVLAAKQNRASIEKSFFDKLDTQLKANEVEINTKEGLGEDVTALKQENTYLRAYTAKLKADHASDSTKNLDLSVAQNKYDFAKRAMELDNKYMGSQKMMNRWMGIQQLQMSLAQMANASGNMISQMVQAKATMEGAEQTQHNEQLDQIKDLFSQAETVIQAVIQLMQAVLSAENDSLMEAIRA